MRINRSATGTRRSHHKVVAPALASCADCGGSTVRHRMCPHCGRYRGRVVVDVTKKALKQDEKRKAKAEAIAAESGAAQAEEAKEEKAEKSTAK